MQNGLGDAGEGTKHHQEQHHLALAAKRRHICGAFVLLLRLVTNTPLQKNKDVLYTT